MKRDIALTNVSFNFLSKSSEFLNLVLNNITSCILLLNKQMELQAYNNCLTTIFSNSENEEKLYQKCGNAIGCAYLIEENKDCGETTFCNCCELRISAIESYLNDKPIFKERITRPYYDKNNIKVIKHLQFSTRLFLFDNERYIIMIIDDITNLCVKN
ncbi:MAG: hypothetical protein A2046_04410 [Bacteroidetes bacterium GWA2_30_7]|nr:MAG: hypothetical protein A2046_04410 [Bacteroidetes bacterium GWA2_30_7]